MPRRTREAGTEARGRRLSPAALARYQEQSRAFHAAAVLAKQRLGATPEAQLRWVVDFARRDLTTLDPEAWPALEYELWALGAWTSAKDPNVGRSSAGPPTLDRSVIRAVQAEILNGLRAITSRRGGGWVITLSNVEEHLSRVNAPDQKAARYHVLQIATDETGRLPIVLAVRDLIRLAGRRLQACPKCGQPFVGVRRQVFCTDECGQQVRDERKRPRSGK